jgi:flagellar protein FlbD
LWHAESETVPVTPARRRAILFRSSPRRSTDSARAVPSLFARLASVSARRAAREWHAMISLTRFDNSQLMVNAEQIEFIEATPDTVITLLSGKKLIVREPVDEIVGRIVKYRQRIYAGLPLCRTE